MAAPRRAAMGLLLVGLPLGEGVLRQCNEASVTHEVFSANEYPAPLASQSMRPIPKELQSAAQRRVPFEPAAHVNDEYLKWEFTDTKDFLHKELKKDPRLKPDDVEVSTDHMSTCTSCKNYNGLKAVLHGAEVVDFGTTRQLLVDDWPISSWTNVVRFLNQPEKRIPVLDTNDELDVRFGCPCSIIQTESPGVSLKDGGVPDGGVILIHSSGIREGDNVNKYRARKSPNFVNGWSEGEWVTIEGINSIGTFTAVSYPSLPMKIGSRTEQWTFLGGYEGYQGEACLAVSSDAIHWLNLHSKGDHPGGPSHDDDDDTWTHTHRCYGESDSFLHRAADAYVLPVVVTTPCPDMYLVVLRTASFARIWPQDKRRHRELVWYREDFGTNGGWREIRGVQAVELDRNFAQMAPERAPFSQTTIKEKLASWYFDRLGKVERFRRHIYAVTLTPYTDDLWLGFMAVIEWAKDSSEAQGPAQPFLQRDTLNIYLITSRDGIHIDDEWVYAHRPLLPKQGKKQGDWDAGLLFPSAQLLTTQDHHYMYFEARPGSVHHEQRFQSIARLGLAMWRRDEIVGLKRAHADQSPSSFISKAFRVVAGGLWIKVACASVCGQVLIEVLHQDGTVWPKRSSSNFIPITGIDGWAEALWQTGSSVSEPLEGPDFSAVPLQSIIRLKFNLIGDAEIYAFEFRRRASSPGLQRTTVGQSALSPTPRSSTSTPPSLSPPSSRPPPPSPSPPPMQDTLVLPSSRLSVDSTSEDALPNPSRRGGLAKHDKVDELNDSSDCHGFINCLGFLNIMGLLLAASAGGLLCMDVFKTLKELRSPMRKVRGQPDDIFGSERHDL